MSLENLMSSLPKIHRSLSEPILNRWVFSIVIKHIFTLIIQNQSSQRWSVERQLLLTQDSSQRQPLQLHLRIPRVMSRRVYTCLCDLHVISLNSILVNSLTFQSIVINHLNTYICINLNCNIYELCKLHKVLSCICISNTLKSFFLSRKYFWFKMCHIILKGFIIGQAAWISVPFT